MTSESRPSPRMGGATAGTSIDAQAPDRGRGRGRGRGRHSQPQTTVNEGIGRGGMSQQSQTTSEVTSSARGLGRGKQPAAYEDSSEGQTRPFKRPRMVGVGIYQAEDGFATLNPGLPSTRVINIGSRVSKRADVVTGDIGYTPTGGFKWKGKITITSTNLERMRTEKTREIRSKVVANQSQTSSSGKTHVPWK